MENILQSTIGTLFIIILLAVLRIKSRKKLPNNVTNKLGINKFYLFAGIFFTIIGVSCFCLMILNNDIKSYITAFLGLALFAGLGLPALMWYFNHKISFNDEVLEVTNSFGKTTKMKWSEITTIKYHNGIGTLQFTNSKCVKLKVHQHIKGLSNLLSMIEKKTNYSEKDFNIGL